MNAAVAMDWLSAVESMASEKYHRSSDLEQRCRGEVVVVQVWKLFTPIAPANDHQGGGVSRP